MNTTTNTKKAERIAEIEKELKGLNKKQLAALLKCTELICLCDKKDCNLMDAENERIGELLKEGNAKQDFSNLYSYVEYLTERISKQA